MLLPKILRTMLLSGSVAWASVAVAGTPTPASPSVVAQLESVPASPAPFGNDAYEMAVQAYSLTNRVSLSSTLARTFYWIGFAVCLSQLVLFLLKHVHTTFNWIERYGTAALIILGTGVAALAITVGRLMWFDALVVFSATMAPKIVHDLVKELGGVLRRPASRRTQPIA